MVLASFSFTYLVLAVVFFASAHFLYAVAFGFKPFNLPALAVCVGIYGILMSSLILHFEFHESVVGGIYAFILMLMVWRAVSRLQFFDDLWTWTKLCSCVGAILFAISDTVIGYEMFILSEPSAWAHAIVMLTYYAGQLGIALSVVDSQVDEFLHCSIRYKYTLKE